MTMAQAELAKALGVHPAVVTRDKQRGMPVHDVEAAREWRRRNVRPRITDKPDDEKPQRPEVETTDDYWASRARREKAEAELAELKLAEQMGQLVRAAEVRASLARSMAGLREALLQMPARVVPLLVADPSPAAMDALLRGEITRALDTFTTGD